MNGNVLSTRRTSLQCRRILGGRKLDKRIDRYDEAAIFDSVTEEDWGE